MTNEEALKTSYEELSPFSDNQRWEFGSNLLHLDLITERVERGAEVIDVGCGIGILALALKFLGYDIRGLEKHLWERDKSNIYYIEDIDSLRSVWQKYELQVFESKPQKKFDAVISIATVEHQKRPKEFIDTLKSLLTPSGLLYLATPNITNFANRFRFMIGRSPVSNIDEFYKTEKFYGHWREYTLVELERMCSLSGLKVKDSLNVQAMRPKIKMSFKNFFRIAGGLVPGGGDTNIIIAQKT